MSEDETQQAEGLMPAQAQAEETTTEEPISHLKESEMEVVVEEDETYERPDWFPEKFWDEKEGPDLENMTKSYTELEKKLSEGKHKAPEQYDTKIFEDNNLNTEDPVVDTFLNWSKKHGVSQIAFDELAGSVAELTASSAQDTKVSMEAEKKALGVNADAIIESNVKWADSLVNKGIISPDERTELAFWGGTAVGQRLMQKVRGMTGDLTKMPVASIEEGKQSEEEFKAETRSLMQDPKYGKDPAFTQSVEKRFEKRYG